MSKPSHKLFPEKRAFQRSLLSWYATHQRDLPWRKNQDPYRVLISEFMLQQTRVDTVIPYFQRFLKLFPTLESLAKAPLQKVLKAWAGLGYYARAHNLHAAAGTICRDLAGRIPATKEELLKLPGLGTYTAGAVASLAFNQPVAALDGNVRRVTSRLFQQGANPGAGSSKKDMEKFLEDWVPSDRASDFNQALMDLGAMICIPSRPRCSHCPVRRFCMSQGVVQKKKFTAKRVREEKWAIALVEKNGRFMIYQNGEKGLLAGLWQFPTLVMNRNDGNDEREALRRFLREEFSLRIKVKTILSEHEYFFTHIHALMKPYLCSFVFISKPPLPLRERVGVSLPRPGGGEKFEFPKSVRWIKPSGFTRYPVSTAMRRIASLLK